MPKKQKNISIHFNIPYNDMKKMKIIKKAYNNLIVFPYQSLYNEINSNEKEKILSLIKEEFKNRENIELILKKDK